ncbi:MAG: hypothetical protein FD157_4068 [Rhodocyclaceae bacterium]|nr:MAG: hypothetical protein FD157_4068 [Rhodocyclaceae bacterium]TNC98010.1 MAG: hypothetical protein FD118_4079 [Rhodocyclaceae bacterium]
MLALLLLLPAAASAQSSEERLGTLFFSPAERSAIVVARRVDQPGVVSDGTSVSVTGLVKRDGQKSTAWINGQTVTEGQAVPAAGVPVIGAKSVTIDGQPVRVRETLDLESGARADALPKGAVSVRRQK